MLLINFLKKISEDILNLNVSMIHELQTDSIISKDMMTKRLTNQLIFFDKLNLNSIKMADVGSGLGIHGNFFYLKNAKVKLFEPNKKNYDTCKSLFPYLNIFNTEFDVDETFDIITMFGVTQFVSKEYIDMIYQHTKILIVDTAKPIDNDYECRYNRKYYDPITEYQSGRKRQFNVYINNKI